MFENIKEDLGRFAVSAGDSSLRNLLRGILSPGFQALLTFRFFNWCRRKKIPTQPFRYIIERCIEIMTGISIPAVCKIGKGLRIHHFGGIIFHPSVEMGDYCTLYHQVTIGDKGGWGRAARIGNHVLLGAGSKLIGEIEIHDHCIVGANAVVTRDMLHHTIAYGNPAVYKQRIQNQDYV